MLTAGADSKERVNIKQAVWIVDGAHALGDLQQTVLHTFLPSYRCRWLPPSVCW